MAREVGILTEVGATVNRRRVAPIDDRALAAGPCPSVHGPTACIGGRRQKRGAVLNFRGGRQGRNGIGSSAEDGDN